MISAVPAVVSIAMAALLGVSGYAGLPVLLAACALVILGLAAGWGTLLDLPDPRGSALTIVLSGGAGLVAVRNGVTEQRPLFSFAVLLAFSVLLAFVHELVRRDGRSDLVESVTGTFVGQFIAVLGCAWVLLPATRLGDKGVLLAAVAVGAAGAAIAVPWPLRVAGWVALAAGAGAGAAMATWVLDLELGRAAAVGAAIASVFAVLSRMLAQEPNLRRTWGALAAGLAPLAASGTAAYAAARLIVG